MKSPSSAHLDFAIIGAMKAGTTSLFDFLAAHPRVFAPRNKEPHYFTHGYGLPAAYYRRLFHGRTAGQLCGEASPTYSWVHRFPDTPRRLALDAPDVRIIYVVRDPLERILSHLHHELLLGRQTEQDPTELVRARPMWERSSYRTTVEAYLEHFSRDRMLVVDLRDLRSGDVSLRGLLDFLDLDPEPLAPLALPASNTTTGRRPVPRVLSRLAVTPVGSMLRDLVPRSWMPRLKASFSRSPSTIDERMGAIDADFLRREVPDRCAAVEDEYRWVRHEFIDHELDPG